MNSIPQFSTWLRFWLLPYYYSTQIIITVDGEESVNKICLMCSKQYLSFLQKRFLAEKIEAGKRLETIYGEF